MLVFLLKQVITLDDERRKRAMELAEENGHLACRDLVRDWGKENLNRLGNDAEGIFNLG